MTHTNSLRLSCVLALALTAQAQDTSGQIEPNAGAWRTWVLKTGNELRLQPPVTEKSSLATEVAWLKDFIAASRRSPNGTASPVLDCWSAIVPLDGTDTESDRNQAAVLYSSGLPRSSVDDHCRL